MRILGIDPGSRFTGWGLLDSEGSRATRLASGTLRLDARRPLAERLANLAEALEALLTEHYPAACALERIFTAKNARTALVLGHARGVILCALARQGIAVHEYTAGQVKQAVVGGGRATKPQVGQMVAVLLGLRGANGHAASLQEDEADALAIALTHAAATRGALPAAGAAASPRGGRAAWARLAARRAQP